MRAKLVVDAVEPTTLEGVQTGEALRFTAVAKSEYGADGADENNTYAKFSPSGRLDIYVANPALFGKFEVGQAYYVDFTPAPD